MRRCIVGWTCSSFIARQRGGGGLIKCSHYSAVDSYHVFYIRVSHNQNMHLLARLYQNILSVITKTFWSTQILVLLSYAVYHHKCWPHIVAENEQLFNIRTSTYRLKGLDKTFWYIIMWYVAFCNYYVCYYLVCIMQLKDFHLTVTKNDERYHHTTTSISPRPLFLEGC